MARLLLRWRWPLQSKKRHWSVPCCTSIPPLSTVTTAGSSSDGLNIPLFILRMNTAALGREWAPGWTGIPTLQEVCACESGSSGSRRGWEVRRVRRVGAAPPASPDKVSGRSVRVEARLCPEQLAGEAVPRPGPVWPLNIWCESKAFSSQERNAAERGLGTGLAGQTLP